MEYNNYYQTQSNNLIIPLVTVWLILVIVFDLLIIRGERTIILFVFQIPVTLFVSLGIIKRIYYSYLAGMLINLSFNIFGTIAIAILLGLLVFDDVKSDLGRGTLLNFYI